MSCVVEVI